MSADIEMKRLFWHSRRGMLELDVLLLPFLQEAYSDLEPADKERFRSGYVRLVHAAQ